MINQKFEAQHSPQLQQADMHAPFAQTGLRIKTGCAAVRPLGIKIVEGGGIQMPAVGGIAEGTEIRVVRRHNVESSTGPRDPVELLRGGYYVADVLDDVNGTEFVKHAIAKRQRAAVNVAEHVGRRPGISVDADGAGKFHHTAADIENSRQFRASPFQVVCR